MTARELDAFIEQYMAIWHETDTERRRALVARLFADDAENVTGRSVSRGHDEIHARVKRSHDEWVVAKGRVFEPTGNHVSQHHLVKFFWKMVPKDGGPTEALGLDVFVLNEAGRIRALYQFNEPMAT